MARATPLSPDERRASIIEVTLPLLREHGNATTTKQIAEAAGIAEGTIFRVFPSKHELFLCTLEQYFDDEKPVERLADIDASLSLREKLLVMCTQMQKRYKDVFALMSAMGMTQPPKSAKQNAAKFKRINDLATAVIQPHAAELRLPPEEVFRILRVLTFSGSHPHIAEGKLLSPDQIVDVVLHGVLKES